MKESRDAEDVEERWAELSARSNLTTALLDDSEANVERLHGEVRNRDAKIERLSHEIERLSQQCQAIMTSTSWRLTAPARLLVTWINGTFRANR